MKKRDWIILGATALVIVGLLVYPAFFKDKSTDPTDRPAATEGPSAKPADPNRIQFSRNVEVVFDVEKPRYRCDLVGATKATSTSEAPRPPVPKPAEQPAPKPETTKVLVLNGLRYAVEIKYREATTGDLGMEGGSSRTLEPGEEVLLHGVAMGEVFTARVLDPAGKVSGTYYCRVVPGPGPVRVYHIIDYTPLCK